MGWDIWSGKDTKSDMENGPVEIVDLPIRIGDFPISFFVSRGYNLPGIWLCHASTDPIESL